MKDIDKLYLEYCGYKPEEVEWDYTTSHKYKSFKAGYDAMQKLINDKGLALQSDMDKTIAQNFALKSRIIELETDLVNTKATLKLYIYNQKNIEKKCSDCVHHIIERCGIGMVSCHCETECHNKSAWVLKDK